ncbi:Dynein heavy chain 5, axonemal [Chamberlinius hualienensis]
MKEMTRVVSYYVTRGLYKKHRFLFNLLLALKIDLNSNKITPEQFTTVIKGGASLDLRTVPPKPYPWIADVTWLNLVQLSRFSTFENILSQISSDEISWRTWFDSDAPEDEPIPDEYDSLLNPFTKLLLIRSWCPDRTMSQAKKYVADALGNEYTQGIILDLEKMVKESDPTTPLICLLSTGSDPTEQIEVLAKKNLKEFKIISMGQGQEECARSMLTASINQGSWLLLQNCHLSLHFCDEIINLLGESRITNQAFRIWITTEPHPDFSISLLQMSIKFTNEPPQGIRDSLRRTYSCISQDLLEYTRLPLWPPLLFSTAFLHTVLQERRKYGLGWNIPYDFNQADFSASCQVIQNILDDMDVKKGVSWVTVSYMLAEVQYGGRVTDDFDKRLLKAFTEIWFTDFLFDQNFIFYFDYKIPRVQNHQQYLDYIDKLPENESPEVFGLHPNASITYQIQCAQEIWDAIVNIQPKDSASSSDACRETLVYKLAEDMLSKLPADYISFEVKEKLQAMGHLLPMNIFLRLEIGRMQKVLTLVRSSLQDLGLAIEGTIVMSEPLKNALDSIYDARVPETWRKASWESSTLGFWFTELMERNTQLAQWLNSGRPISFWMTGFFNPQGFLTAMRQEVTRCHRGWALDTVVLQNTVTRYAKEELTEPPAVGVYVHGLFLEGAGWDKKMRRLTEPKPKVLYEQMPVFHMFAVNSVPSRDPNAYECPLYKKPGRADGSYICSLDLRTNISPYHWIFRGVALLCDNK